MIGNIDWKIALLPESATVNDAIRSLEISGLKLVVVVTHDDIPVGTVSDGDLRRGMLVGMGLEAPIVNYMNRAPLLAPSNLGDDEILEIMSVNKISQLPLVDEHGRITSIKTLEYTSTSKLEKKTMIIMAGGRGSRLAPHTNNIPKPLVKVGGKPMIEHIIEKAKEQGFTKFIVSINHMGNLVEKYLGNGSQRGVTIEYIRESRPLGTAGSLSLFDGELKKSLVVTNCDVLGNFSYIDILNYHEAHDAIATVAIKKHTVQNEFGVIDLNGMEITGFTEKPQYISYINVGIYVLNKKILGLLNRNEVCDMPTLLKMAIDKSQKVIAFPLHENWLDVGRPSDLKAASELYIEVENE